MILAGMIFVILPGALSFLKTRHLDDAIFKMENHQPWPKTLVAETRGFSGNSGPGTAGINGGIGPGAGAR